MAECRPASSSSGHVSQQPSGKQKEVEDFNNWCDDPIFGEQTWIAKKLGGKEPTTEEKFGATWDWVPSQGKVSEAIRISDPSYERLVNRGNIFNSCVHYVVPIHCGCNGEVFTLVCQKCLLHFCSDPCLEQNLRGKGGLSESAMQKLRARKLQRPCNGNNPINHTNGPHPQRKDSVANHHHHHPTRNDQNGPQRHYPVGSQQMPHVTPVKTHNNNPSETTNNSNFEWQRQKSRQEEKHPILAPKSTNRVELVLRDRDPMQHNNNNFNQINPGAANPFQQNSLLGPFLVNTSVPPPNMLAAGAGNRNYDQNVHQNNISMQTSVMPRKMPPSQFNPEADRHGKDNKNNSKMKQNRNKDKVERPVIGTRGAHRAHRPVTPPSEEVNTTRVLERENWTSCLSSSSLSPDSLSSSSRDCLSSDTPPRCLGSTTNADTSTTIIGRGRGRGRKLQPEETQKNSFVEVSPEVSPASAENKLEDFPISDSTIVATIRVETPIEKPFCPPLLSTFEMGCIYVKTPHVMSLCTSESRRVTKTLLEEIEKIETLEKAGNIQPGDYVLAPYCEGDPVNRAKILQILEQRTVSIYYIDFGITDKVAEDSLCKLPENLQNFHPNAIKFSLSNVKHLDSQNSWSNEANAKVNALCKLKTVRCVVKYVTETQTGLLYIGEVKIKQSHKWVDVGEQMIEAGVAEKMSESIVKSLVDDCYWNDYPMQLFPESACPELALNTKMKVDLSHVNHLQDFYVTTVKEKQDRERLMSELNKIMLYPEMCSIFLPQEEPIGVAFIEKQWWRVKVTLIRMDQTVDVFLIDKGETVKKSVKLNLLRKYPDHLPRDKAYAYHCQLPILPVNSTHWDSNLIQNLKKVQQHQQERPEVKCFHIENGIHTVELYPTRDSPGWSHNLILINDAKEPSSMKNAEFLQESHSEDQYQTQTPGPVTQENNLTRQTSPSSQTETGRSQNTEILNKYQVKVNNGPEQEPDENFSGNGLSDVSPADLNIRHLAAAPKLSTLLKEKVQFSVYLTKMWGIVYIVPQKNRRNQINEIVKDFATHYRNCDSRKRKDLCFKEDDVVCLKTNNKDVRAVIDRILEPDAIVRLLDYGEFQSVSTRELMPVSQDIMKFPPSGYSINLANVSKKMKLLSSKYELLEEKLNNSVFILDTVQGPHPLDPMTTIATLRNVDESSFIGDNSLTDLIASYEKMAWELYFEGGYTTTSDIITKGGNWHVQTVEEFYNLEQEVALNEAMSSTVLRAFIFEEDLMVVLVKPNSGELIENLKIISNKMESFYHKVKVGDPDLLVNANNGSSSFVAVRIANPSDVVKSVFDNPKWHRCIKSGNDLISVDHHTEWQADSDGQFQVAEIREMCPEFLEIPSSCILAKISGIDMSIESSRLAMQQVFSPGCAPKYILTSVDTEEGEKSIYEMKCPFFEELIFKL